MFERLKDKKVLVTGAAGFVGSHLSERLIHHGAYVVGFDNLSTGSKENINHLMHNDNFSFVEGDANEYGDLKLVFQAHNFDYVFHYACLVGVIRTIGEPLAVLRDIDGIRHILDLSQKNNVKKVMFSSSSEVYGEPIEIPEREDGPINAKLPYATVKLVCEQYMRAYYEKYGLPTCSMRFFNVYGPRQDATALGFVVGVFIRQALNGEPITILGEGTQTRDFVYVDDNIEATLRLLLTEESDGEVVNIGAGRPISLNELADTVIAHFGDKNIEKQYRPLRAGGEILHRNPDVDKMYGMIDFTLDTSLDEGLKKTIEWYKSII